jgi:hypothetical protein
MGPFFAAAAALAAQASTPSGTPAPTDAPKLKTGSSTYADLEAGVGYSTNPVLSTTSNAGRGYGRVAVNAVHTRVSERTTTAISAYAQNVTYTSRYGSLQSLSLSGRHDAAVTEQFRVFGDARLGYDKGGQLDSRITILPDVPPLPGTINNPIQLLPPGSDFLSVTGRTYFAAAHIGGSLALSQHENVSASSGVERVVFRGAGQDSAYTRIPVSLGYDRQLNERATIGGRLSLVDTNYRGPFHSQQITPQLTGSLLLSERVSFNGAIGASFASFDNGVVTRHSTGLSAQASLCGTGERDRYCARVGVDQQAATTAGPAKSISAGIDYSRQLDASSRLGLSADLSHYSSPISVLAGRAFSSATYYRVAADYSRRLNRRLFGGASVAARKLSQSGPDPKTDFNASVFVRYRLGDLQ